MSTLLIPIFPYKLDQSDFYKGQLSCKKTRGAIVFVMVQFYPWYKCYFPLFWGMVSYDIKTVREINFKPRINLNHNIYNENY